METILRTENLCKIYGSGENQVYAVRNADIEIKKGEFAAIIGNPDRAKVRCFTCWRSGLSYVRQSLSEK